MLVRVLPFLEHYAPLHEPNGVQEILPNQVQLQNPKFDIWFYEVNLEYSVWAEFSFSRFCVLTFDEIMCDYADLLLP